MDTETHWNTPTGETCCIPPYTDLRPWNRLSPLDNQRKLRRLLVRMAISDDFWKVGIYQVEWTKAQRVPDESTLTQPGP
jgi:hypothetical protein